MSEEPKQVYKIDSLYFSGLLKWTDVEKLVDEIKISKSPWHYVYTQEDDESTNLEPAEAAAFLSKIMDEIKKLDKICGWFYVHTKENPGVIKIYHPKMSGGGCSLFTPPPWIIMSIEKPEDIADLESYKPIIKIKKKGLGRLFV